MTHPHQPSPKRNRKAMRRERAPGIDPNRPQSPPAKHLPRKIAATPSKPPHPLRANAGGMGPGVPPRGFYCVAPPVKPPQTRQIRHKSKTHSRNQLPS